MEPISKFVASQAKKEVNEAAQLSEICALPSIFPTRDSSLHANKSKSFQNSKNRRDLKRKSRLPWIWTTEAYGTWYRRQFIKSSYDSSRLTDEEQLKAPQLSIIHHVRATFADALGFCTYRLHNRSLRCNGKVAARTTSFDKRMETIRGRYWFDDGNPVAKLSFLAQFKGACDSNKI